MKSTETQAINCIETIEFTAAAVEEVSTWLKRDMSTVGNISFVYNDPEKSERFKQLLVMTLRLLLRTSIGLLIFLIQLKIIKLIPNPSKPGSTKAQEQ